MQRVMAAKRSGHPGKHQQGIRQTEINKRRRVAPLIYKLFDQQFGEYRFFLFPDHFEEINTFFEMQ